MSLLVEVQDCWKFLKQKVYVIKPCVDVLIFFKEVILPRIFCSVSSNWVVAEAEKTELVYRSFGDPLKMQIFKFSIFCPDHLQQFDESFGDFGEGCKR